MPEKENVFDSMDPDFFKPRSFEIPVIGHFFMHTTLKDTIDMIDKVLYHDPATIIYWKDKTKTVVKCQEGFQYDEVVGFLMCILKKTLNGKQYHKLCDAMVEPYALRKLRLYDAEETKKREEMRNRVKSRIDILEDSLDELRRVIYKPSCNPNWWEEKDHGCGNCSCKK